MFALVGNNWVYESSQSVKCPEITLNFGIELWDFFLNCSHDKEEPKNENSGTDARKYLTKNVLAYHERKYEVHRQSDASSSCVSAAGSEKPVEVNLAGWGGRGLGRGHSLS